MESDDALRRLTFLMIQEDFFMFRISCFADEISPKLEQQLQVMHELDIHYLELRTVWDKNVLQLSLDEARRLKQIFDENDVHVSSIGSPIGKVDIDCNFEEYLERFDHAITLAKIFETPYIRIFSFYHGEHSLDECRQKVLSRLRIMLDIAKRSGVVLLMENEAGIYGQKSVRCQDIYEQMHDMSFLGVIDPSNYVVAGEDPMDSLRRVHRYVEYVHIKDSIHGTGEIVVAGKGDGKIEEILDFLRYHEGMFVSLEPHLREAGANRGFSGIELFRMDHAALTALLQKLGISYQ